MIRNRVLLEKRNKHLGQGLHDLGVVRCRVVTEEAHVGSYNSTDSVTLGMRYILGSRSYLYVDGSQGG